MRHRLLLLVCLFPLFTLAAHAQAGELFANFNYTSLNTSNVNEVDTNGTVVDTTFPVKLNKPGVTVGADGNFINNHTLTLGAEGRATIGAGVYMFLGGLRFAVHARSSRFRPYIMVGGGGVLINQTETITTISKAPFPPSTTSMPFPNDELRGVFAAYGGVDIGFSHLFAWRAEAGGGYTTSHALTLVSSPGGSFFSINTGPVFRF